jgi:S1-C subfamily serine protease
VTRERVVIEAADGAFSPQAVYDRAAPGVVTVRSVFGEDALGAGGQGSGFVVSERGEILTNAHVVTDGQASGDNPIAEAEEVFVEFADRKQVPAEIVGWDPHGDVALLRVEPDGLDLQPLELASGNGIEVGQAVAAIGSPFGEEQSMSVGVISATDRSIESLTEFRIDGAIQTDASINPGNSGGPLLDVEGRVIGLNQSINTTSGGDEGVGFAVPIAVARRSLEQLREDGEVEYAFIGVSTQALYPQLAERLGFDSPAGALIAEVVTGGPADDAGLRGGERTVQFQAQQIDVGGDVILSVDGEELVGESDLARIVAAHRPGDSVRLLILRGGEREEFDVDLEGRPDSGQSS